MNKYSYSQKDASREALQKALQEALNKTNSSLITKDDIKYSDDILLGNLKSALRGRLDYHIYTKIKVHSIYAFLEEGVIKNVQLKIQHFDERNESTINYINEVLNSLEYKKIIAVSKIDNLIDQIKNYKVHKLNLVY